MKRLFVFLTSAFVLLMVNVPSVFACSYGYIPPATINTMLNSDVIVRGVVVRNSGGNSIIEVERYIQGSGSRYLFVFREAPDSFRRKVVRTYDYGCNYASHSIGNVGTRAYFGLDYQENGTYSLSYFEKQDMFEIVDDESGHYVRYFEYAEPEYEELHASEEELESIFAESLGYESNLPDEDSQMPRFRVLHVQTESGQVYQMPVDSYQLLPTDYSACTENCPIVSSDGSHYAVSIPDEPNVYWIWYYPNPNGDDWDEVLTSGGVPIRPPRVNAEALLFSPNGDHLLTWYQGELRLYSLAVWQNVGNNGLLPALTFVWSVRLALDEDDAIDSYAGLGAWSSNSNAFAYWDGDGLRWLDIQTMRVPNLVYERNTLVNGEIPSILELSTTGRYLRFGEIEDWHLLDVFTGTLFDDVLVNPSENTFVQISPDMYITDTVSRTESSLGECIMFDLEGNCLMEGERPFDSCLLPLASCLNQLVLASTTDYALQEIHWNGSQSLIFLSCSRENSQICRLGQANLGALYSSHRETNYEDSYLTNGFAFDSQYRQSAWAVDDYVIRFPNDYRAREGIDFSDVLDSPIESIEWGEPLW